VEAEAKVEPKLDTGGTLLRYVINGLVATAVHFAVLTFNLEWLRMDSAGVANVIAAAFGIVTSFLGSRYFVFRRTDMPIFKQAMSFALLYAATMAMHGGVLFLLSDVMSFDYRLGFCAATTLQVVVTYIGNKTLVFK
jgi:putative flippase GtrA